MNIKQFYTTIGENYNNISILFNSDEKLKKYILMFKNDSTYVDLLEAIKNKDREIAFRYVHTLKGIALNLGFNHLFEVSSTLTELLRNNEYTIDESTPIEPITLVYNSIIEAINNID